MWKFYLGCGAVAVLGMALRSSFLINAPLSVALLVAVARWIYAAFAHPEDE